MALPKAFLSHSSYDKPFVEAVAKRLGRQQVQFDKWVFEVGQDFVKAISSSLNASDTFVLFASRASLKSLWVKMEISQALILTKSAQMKSALVFIIEPGITHADLPKWMQKGLIKTGMSANAVARSVQHHLNSIRGIDQSELFFGRNSLLEQFAEKLFPISGQKPPHLLIVSGLEGVGRRTFVSHVLKDSLSMRMGPVFHLRKTDGIDALHIALLNELGDADSVAELAKAIAAFRKQSSAERAQTLAKLLSRVGEENVAPCIVDDGALLESSAVYKPEGLALLHALKAYPEIVVSFVHTHKPRLTEEEFSEYESCYEKIPSLDAIAIKQLVTKRLQMAKVEFSGDDVERLTPYLAGYPPAVNLAVGYIKNYGMSMLIADTSTLVNFQIQTFAEVLAKLGLSDIQWKTLRVLAAGLDLPLEALAGALKLSQEVLVPELRRLVDLNLVLLSGSSFSIAYPIRFAVQASRGTLSSEEFSSIGRSLKEMFWEGKDGLPSYEVIESTITSLLRSNDPELEPFGDIIVPSLLFRAAKDLYEQWGHANWEKSLALLKRLLVIDPNHRGGLVLLLKIQVKMTRFAEAEQTLKHIQTQKMPERFSLEAYLLWKQKKYTRAITLYKVALANGERAVEIYHGLASCLFQTGELKEATRYIKEGLEKRSRRIGLLLDLAAKMAIVTKDFAAATDFIEQLRRLNATTDYNHRAATLLIAQKNPLAALPHARAAVEDSRGRYEIDSVLISVLIDLREFEEAEQRLQTLEKNDRASGSRRDVRLGLRVKFHLRQGDWRTAESYWEPLGDKQSPVQRALRMELLERKIQDKNLSQHIREANISELQVLQSQEHETILGEDDYGDDGPDSDSSPGLDL